MEKQKRNWNSIEGLASDKEVKHIQKLLKEAPKDKGRAKYILQKMAEKFAVRWSAGKTGRAKGKVLQRILELLNSEEEVVTITDINLLVSHLEIVEGNYVIKANLTVPMKGFDSEVTFTINKSKPEEAVKKNTLKLK